MFESKVVKFPDPESPFCPLGRQSVFFLRYILYIKLVLSLQARRLYDSEEFCDVVQIFGTL